MRPIVCWRLRVVAGSKIVLRRKELYIYDQQGRKVWEKTEDNRVKDSTMSDKTSWWSERLVREVEKLRKRPNKEENKTKNCANASMIRLACSGSMVVHVFVHAPIIVSVKACTVLFARYLYFVRMYARARDTYTRVTYVRDRTVTTMNLTHKKLLTNVSNIM